MFEYCYLITLILCTGRIFSYEYLDRRNAVRQEYAIDRNPVEFDVASFIQPDDVSIERAEPMKTKSSFKHMKFPFFSPNKTKPLEQKRAKKRKLFCFSSRKKTSTVAIATVENKVPLHSEKKLISYKNKRSYEMKLCPVCHKKFYLKPHYRSKKSQNSVIHNSRQYYQLYSDGENKENLFKDKKDYLVDAQKYDRRREKRQKELERDRQMRLLDEIQRKVNKVKIVTPTFDTSQKERL